MIDTTILATEKEIQMILIMLRKHLRKRYLILRHCNLYNANLRQTDLSSANLSESDCSEADLELANMSTAILKLTNLRNAKNLPIPRHVAAEKGALI
ncbi:MAG: pentapeptide repeat-containing protein [Nitrososphaeraceae archaeon]|nr:pentapeptide repeat-containing protein [Nitrososphaeraceae archaeon]